MSAPIERGARRLPRCPTPPVRTARYQLPHSVPRLLLLGTVAAPVAAPEANCLLMLDAYYSLLVATDARLC